MEIHALERENEKAKGKDEGIVERLEAAKASMRTIDDELDPLRAQYEASKGRADEIQLVKERIEELKQKGRSLRHLDYVVSFLRLVNTDAL